MTSHTISPMSCKSPSVRVIRSIDNFDALAFFRGPIRSVRCWRFNSVDVFCCSALPSSSFASYPREGDFWPSCTFIATSYHATAAATFCCSDTICAASHASYASTITTSFLFFSAKCAMHSLTSSFFLVPQTSPLLQCLECTTLVAMSPVH